MQTCRYLLPSSYSEENKKIGAIVSFYDLFIKMQTAEETYVHCATTTTVKQPVKTFLIFRFPFGTEPIALLELEPDLATCICKYKLSLLFLNNWIMKNANSEAAHNMLRDRKPGAKRLDEFSKKWK